MEFFGSAADFAENSDTYTDIMIDLRPEQLKAFEDNLKCLKFLLSQYGGIMDQPSLSEKDRLLIRSILKKRFHKSLGYFEKSAIHQILDKSLPAGCHLVLAALTSVVKSECVLTDFFRSITYRCLTNQVIQKGDFVRIVGARLVGKELQGGHVSIVSSAEVDSRLLFQPRQLSLGFLVRSVGFRNCFPPAQPLKRARGHVPVIAVRLLRKVSSNWIAWENLQGGSKRWKFMLAQFEDISPEWTASPYDRWLVMDDQGTFAFLDIPETDLKVGDGLFLLNSFIKVFPGDYVPWISFGRSTRVQESEKLSAKSFNCQALPWSVLTDLQKIRSLIPSSTMEGFYTFMLEGSECELEIRPEADQFEPRRALARLGLPRSVSELYNVRLVGDNNGRMMFRANLMDVRVRTSRASD